MYPPRDLQKMKADMEAKVALYGAAQGKAQEKCKEAGNASANSANSAGNKVSSAQAMPPKQQVQPVRDRESQITKMLLAERAEAKRYPGHVEGCTGLTNNKDGNPVHCACVAEEINRAFATKMKKRQDEILKGLLDDKERNKKWAVDNTNPEGFHLVTDEEAQKVKEKERQTEEWDLLEEAYPKGVEAAGRRASELPSDMLYDFYSKARD
jgi:hypothetical protein